MQALPRGEEGGVEEVTGGKWAMTAPPHPTPTHSTVVGRTAAWAQLFADDLLAWANTADEFLELAESHSQAAETGIMDRKPHPPERQLPHLHITLGGIDMIEKGLDCHPFDRNPALEVVEEGISIV